MKVFISHAGGGRSATVAAALHDWLPNVIQALEPWMSATDIAPGRPWFDELRHGLEDAHFGILCVTKANALAPWLLFEAGILVQAFQESFLVPLLIDVEPADLPAPLQQFQGVPATRPGFETLVGQLNAQRVPSLAPDVLATAFRRSWDVMQQALAELPEESAAAAAVYPGRIYVSVGEPLLESAPEGIQWDNSACFLVRERDRLREQIALVAVPVGAGVYEVEMEAGLRAALQPERHYQLQLKDDYGNEWRVPPFFLYQQSLRARPARPLAGPAGQEED